MHNRMSMQCRYWKLFELNGKRLQITMKLERLCGFKSIKWCYWQNEEEEEISEKKNLFTMNFGGFHCRWIFKIVPNTWAMIIIHVAVTMLNVKWKSCCGFCIFNWQTTRRREKICSNIGWCEICFVNNLVLLEWFKMPSIDTYVSYTPLDIYFFFHYFFQFLYFITNGISFSITLSSECGKTFPIEYHVWAPWIANHFIEVYQNVC